MIGEEDGCEAGMRKLCGNEIVLYLDCGSGYMSLHM